MLAGTKIPAGLSHSTVLPDFDFEAYSEAGYYFCPEAKRFKGLLKGKPGLEAVGSAVYSEHPSTEIISLSYDLKDGKGPRLWIPCMALPIELFDYIRDGGVIEAWNSGFEYLLWKNVCHARYGWPPLPLAQLRCAMAKGKAFGLPGKLEKAAEVTCADVQKDKRGKALIRLLCIPQKPTRKQPNFRNQDPALLGEMYSYNIDDIRSECAVSKLTPDLSPEELEIWLLDQRINQRGVHIDKEALDNCISIVEQAFERYNSELVSLTAGSGITSATELDRIKAWLATQGVVTDSLDKGAVEDLLKQLDPATPAYRVVEIRSLLGAASVKKLFAIDRMMPADRRLRDLFAFCGADRTGRWAGRGPQPQNLPNSGPEVWVCESCGAVQWKGLKACRYCSLGAYTDAQLSDWCLGAVEACLTDIATRNLDWVESQWGDAVAAVSGCIRGLFSAAPGNDLVCSDFSAIEAVILAFMAGEQWRMDVFNTHGKIYEASASTVSGVPLDEILRYPKDHNGKHHPLRKKGKVNELACFASDTEVLTDSGWRRIVDIGLGDKVHDGVGFVRHDGVIDQGERLTLKMGSVTVTPEHKFLIGEDEWATAEDLSRSTKLLKQAINTANSLFCSKIERSLADSLGIGASAPAKVSAVTSRAICDSEKAPGATHAPRKNQQNQTRCTETPAQTRSTGKGCSTGCPPQCHDARNPGTGSSICTVGGAYRSSRNGCQTERSGSPTSAPCRGGMSLSQQSTELTTTEITSPEICGLSPTENSRAISRGRGGLSTQAKKCLAPSSAENSARSMPARIQFSESCQKGSPQSKSSNSNPGAEAGTARVYDLLNCGTRSRFVIRTGSGPLIAHNCGYGGGLGAAKAFGADKLGLTDDEIKLNVKTWRKASPAIAGYGNKGISIGLPASPNRPGYRDEELGFWYGIQSAAYKAIRNPGQCFGFRGISYGMKGGKLYARLPSGRSLVYHDAKLEPGFTPWGAGTTRMTYMGWNTNYLNGPTGWMKMDTYGPKLVENVVQAIARDILAFAMVNLEAAGYPIVMHVHDEVISEVPKGNGSIEEFERIMATMPPWCADWPIKAAGGWRGLRYRKD